MEDLKETDHKSFNEHRLEIEKIVMGCRGVKSREVHWSEAVPMLAAYVVRNTNKQLLKEERNKAIDDVVFKIDERISGYTYIEGEDIAMLIRELMELKPILKSLKGKSQ